MSHFTFLYTTRVGTYFHLTPYHIKQLNLTTALLSIGDFIHMQEFFQKAPSFKNYIGLDESTLTYLTNIDCYKEKCVEPTHIRKMIKLQQLQGLSLFSIDSYHKLVDNMKPDWLVSLTELNTSKSKSYKNSVEKSFYFLTKILEQHKTPKIFASLQGNLNEEQMSSNMYSILEFAFPDRKFPSSKFPNFYGIAFYGFNKNDPIKLKEAAFKAAFNELSQDLKDNLKFLLPGYGDVISVLWGASQGIECFEIEEPFTLADQNQALILSNINPEEVELEQLSKESISHEEFNGCKLTYLQFPLKENADQTSLDEKCNCFTCRNHTKLYINHLVEYKELNSKVLLSIHNTFQYQQLKSKLDKMKEEQKLIQWIRWMLQQLKK